MERELYCGHGEGPVPTWEVNPHHWIWGRLMLQESALGSLGLGGNGFTQWLGLAGHLAAFKDKEA